MRPRPGAKFIAYEGSEEAEGASVAAVVGQPACGYVRRSAGAGRLAQSGGPPPALRSTVGDVLLGPVGNPLNVNLALTQLEFFDHHLRGEPADEGAPVRIFIMGANEWREETEWPLARAVPTRLYLRANGALSREAPADEQPDEFSYDPGDPVPTVGGSTYLPGSGFFADPRDRRAVEDRSDVLVYTSQPLQNDLEVIGPVNATLSVATSVPDTDFTSPSLMSTQTAARWAWSTASCGCATGRA